MNALYHRESEREAWWRPRAEGVAAYIATRLASSDVVLLQEWWCDARFEAVFDAATGDAPGGSGATACAVWCAGRGRWSWWRRTGS
jgi:hypothetical protein